MKVVFDTNVLVSALVFPGGRGEEALLRILEERDQLYLSRAILDELLSVLARKFARDAEELSRAAVLLGEISTLVKPARRVKALPDDPDNRILECAAAARGRRDRHRRPGDARARRLRRGADPAPGRLPGHGLA